VAEIEVHGLAELQKVLDGLPAKIEWNLMRGALRAGQKVMLDEAKRLVPEYHGELKKSLRISFRRKSKKFGWVRMHLVAGNKQAWYSHLVEFGTASFYTGSGRSVGRPYAIKPKKKKAIAFGGGSAMGGGVVVSGGIHPGIKPTSFMRRTFDTMQQPALQTMADYLRRRIPVELAKQ
jgi:HK97 gp10 family phage protein